MTEKKNAASLFQGFELQATIFNSRQLEDSKELTAAPHLALVGRSNVGKSSLLNSLAGRKALAKVSSSPGKTRSINFYKGREYGPQAILLADLPGYGFARCGHAERESWRKLLDRYFADATGLKGILLLLDCRIPPQDSDKAMAAYAISRRIPLLPVLTKADKISQRERSLKQREWEAIIGLTPMPASSKSKLGINSLCEKMLEMLGISPDAAASPDSSGKKASDSRHDSGEDAEKNGSGEPADCSDENAHANSQPGSD